MLLAVNKKHKVVGFCFQHDDSFTLAHESYYEVGMKLITEK